jgi:hypothetical protein
VRGARLVPDKIEEDKAVGLEPGGGVRAIVAGLRVVELPNGAVLAAHDRFPQSTAIPIALPERLGGGFLFQVGSTIWRSDRWLGPARPLFTSIHAITRTIVGLDRVYLRGQNGPLASFFAFDPRTGKALDLGPWPSSPFVGPFAAYDAWRALAITDLRGPLLTLDAGATWRPLSLPVDAKEVVVTDDALAIGGPDASPARTWTWFEVRPDGQVGKLPGPAIPRDALFESPGPPSIAPAMKPFGRRPLAAAVEDGWPLGDGTVILARDGALARVRLADGAPVEAVSDAYPLKPSRCHPLSLARPDDPGGFGFVCGEVRGRTVLYRYDVTAGRLVELRRFDHPRVVLPSGNGALAVRGGCAADAPATELERAGGASTQVYCVLGRDDRFREIRLRGQSGGERVVVLADGRVAVLSPPEGDLSTARLTLLTNGASSTVPLAFPPLHPDASRALRLGVWMDGFEERRPGVLGGWIEAAGALVGIEIDVTGTTRVGEYIRDAGSPMVSGRYGFGWTASRRGYETTDGGMSWTKDLELPPPLVTGKAVTSRACGPVGCLVAGWLRVGWGPSADDRPPPVPPPPSGTWLQAPPPLELDCSSLGAPPREASATSKAETPSMSIVNLPTLRTGPWGSPWSAAASDIPPFYARPAPPLRPDEAAL